MDVNIEHVIAAQQALDVVNNAEQPINWFYRGELVELTPITQEGGSVSERLTNSNYIIQPKQEDTNG